MSLNICCYSGRICKNYGDDGLFYMKLTRFSFIWLACGVVLLCAGTALSFAKESSALSKKAIEKALEDVMGVDVSIDNFTISSKTMSVQVRTIAIDNPPDFKRGSAITIDKIDMDLRSLDLSQLAFKNVSVAGVVFHVDTNDETVNLEGLKRAIAAQRDNHRAPDLLQGSLAIDHIVITGMRTEPANITAAIAHGLSPETLAEDHLQGLGTDSQETAQAVLTQVIVHLLNVALYEADKKGYLEALPPENRPVTNYPR